jgi:flagellin FlaB
MAKANRKARLTDDPMGVVGVGTLIVFIAMVLVAAIASAVIIKTAYTLKDQAERIGEAAANEATGGPKVLDIVGSVAGPPPTLDWIQFTITTWDGAEAINIEEMRIHWIGPSQEVYLSLRTTGGNPWPNPPPCSTTQYCADEEPADPSSNWNPASGSYWLDDDNVLKIFLECGAAGFNDPVGPNEMFTVIFMPAHGPPVREIVVAPSDFGSASYIDLTSS